MIDSYITALHIVYSSLMISLQLRKICRSKAKVQQEDAYFPPQESTELSSNKPLEITRHYCPTPSLKRQLPLYSAKRQEEQVEERRARENTKWRRSGCRAVFIPIQVEPGLQGTSGGVGRCCLSSYSIRQPLKSGAFGLFVTLSKAALGADCTDR